MSGYGPGFAPFYDAHWRSFAERAAPDILQWARTELGEASHLLDLCCGTGASSEPFARAGWHVTGVDLSPDMITIAQDRVGGAYRPTQVRFLVGDIADLPLPDVASFDLVISLFDSLNHLPDLPTLERVFVAAACRTRAGGALVFDLNTVIGLRHWDATTHAFDDDRGTVIAEGHYDEDTNQARMDVIAYLPDPDATSYRKYTETNIEHAFSTEQVIAALHRSGWVDVHTTTYGQLSDDRDDIGTLPRITFLARRSVDAG